MWILNEIESHKKKKISSKIIIITILVLIWWYFSYGFLFNSNNEVVENEISNFTTTTWDLKTSISGDGKVLYMQDYNLNFPISWTVVKLLKDEWDIVKVGDVIATLDTTYLWLSVDKARISLNKANADLEIKKNQYSLSDIKLSQNQLDLSEASLNNTKASGEIDISNAQNSIITSEIALESAKIDLDIAKSNLSLVKLWEEEKYSNVLEDLYGVIWSNLSFNKDMLYKIDELLWVTLENKDKNDDIEDYLGLKNTTIKNNAINLFKEANNNFLLFVEEWKNYKAWDENLVEIDYFLNKAEENTKATNRVLWSTLETIKNSIVSVNSLSQSQIDSYINEYENNIIATKKEIQNLVDEKQKILEQKTLLDTKIISSENSVLSSEAKYNSAIQKVNDAKLSLSNSEKKLENNINLSEKQLEISKTNLWIKVEGPSSIDLAPYYTNIEIAQKSLQEAQIKFNDATLRSPIDWKIVSVNWNIGSFVGWDKDASFVTITNNNKFYVESYVEELDITRIMSWAKVYLSFDALDWVSLDWKVYYISDKSTTDNNWVVTYKVEIQFEHEDSEVREWMTTYVDYITNEVKNAKIVPVWAVKPVSWKPSVMLENGIWVSVITWFTDGKMVEIISGLEKGDKVIY